MDAMDKELQLNGLQDLYRDDASARAILDDFAKRSNAQRVTKVEQMVNRLKSQDLRRPAVIATFRGLEKHNCGRFVEGRKGHPSRFEWSKNSLHVGRAASAGADQAEALNGAGATELPRNLLAADGLLTHSFPMRSGVTAQLSIPPNISLKEAERLASWVKTLAIPED